MPKYVINGKTIEADSVLTDEEIDEIASSITPAPKEEAIQNEQVAENLDKEAQGIQPTVDVDGVAIPVTAERTQESVNKELESRVKEAEKNPEKEPSFMQIGAGLLAEIGISESSKVAGTLAGAGTAVALGQMGPQAFLPEELITVPIVLVLVIFSEGLEVAQLDLLLLKKLKVVIQSTGAEPLYRH